MSIEITLPNNLSDPSTIPQHIGLSVKRYLRFDKAGLCIGTGASYDNTLPEDGVWCTDAQALVWQNASLTGGSISFDKGV